MFKKHSVFVPLNNHVRISYRQQLALKVSRLRFLQFEQRLDLCLELGRAWLFLAVHLIVSGFGVHSLLDEFLGGGARAGLALYRAEAVC